MLQISRQKEIYERISMVQEREERTKKIRVGEISDRESNEQFSRAIKHVKIQKYQSY